MVTAGACRLRQLALTTSGAQRCGKQPRVTPTVRQPPPKAPASARRQRRRQPPAVCCGTSQRPEGDVPSSEQQAPPTAPSGSSANGSESQQSGGCEHDVSARQCDLSTTAPEPATSRSASISSYVRNSKHDAAIIALALPAVIALAADPLLDMVDTIFVGQGGADALAALGVNTALFTFSFLVFNFLATATTPIVASALATGDKEEAGKVTLQALLLASVLGTVLAGCLVVFADGALDLMGAGPEAGHVHVLAKEFLQIRALAAPAALLMTVGQGAFRGLQDMRTPLGITLAANAINLGLDSVLILGLGWGVRGAATATTTAEWAAAVAYLAILWQRREALGGLNPRLVLGSKLADALVEMAPFLKAGGAMLMRTALLLGTKTLASATAARLGVVPIAAHQVVGQLWLLSSLIIDSLAIAGQTLVAVQLGKKDVREARAVSNRLLVIGIGGGALLAGAFWLAEPIIPGIFTNDSDVAAAVREILPIAVAFLPVNAAVYVFDGIVTGAGDFKFMAGAMVVSAVVAVGLLLGVEPFDLGLPGVWYALGVLMVTRLATMVWRYQSEDGPLPPSAERFSIGAADPLRLARFTEASGAVPSQLDDRAAASSSTSRNGLSTDTRSRMNTSSSGSTSSSSSSSSSFEGSVELLDDLQDLSNNAVERKLPQQRPAKREAGRTRSRR